MSTGNEPSRKKLLTWGMSWWACGGIIAAVFVGMVYSGVAETWNALEPSGYPLPLYPTAGWTVALFTLAVVIGAATGYVRWRD